MDIDDLIDGLEIETGSSDPEQKDAKKEDQAIIPDVPPVSVTEDEKTRRDFRVLYELFIEISKAMDVDLVINLIIEVMNKIISYESCLLYIYENEKLNLKCSRNFSEKIEKKVNNFIKEDIVEWAINADKPVVLEDPDYTVVVAPLIVDNKPRGLLSIFCLKEFTFSRHDMEMVSMLSTQAANAIDKVILYEELEHKEDQLEVKISEISELYEELVAVYEFSVGLEKIFSVSELFEYVLKMAMKTVEAEKGIIYRCEENGFSYLKSVNHDEQYICSKITSPTGYLAQVTEKPEIFYVNEYESENENTISYGFESNRMFFIPFDVKEQLYGVIILGTKISNKKYTEKDKKLIRAISTQLSRAVDNLILRQEYIEKEKIEKELDLAREIQANMLPETAPEVEGFTTAACSKPARHVGGDYYDFIALDDNHLGFFIGDVSGKGIPAALLMTMVRSVIKSEINNVSPDESVFNRTNNIIAKDIYVGKFITMYYVLLEKNTSQIYYSNAGHNPMLVYRAATGEFQYYDTEGFPIGIVEVCDYFVQRTAMNDGDIILLYTDGITEAMSVESEEYGIKKLEDVVLRCCDKEAPEILKEVFDDVEKHAGDAPQHDDITLIVIKKKSNASRPAIAKKLLFKSTFDEVEKNVTEIMKELENYVSSREVIFEIKLSLNELFINAVKHGNKMDSSKTVEVKYSITNDFFELSIEDEGEGFCVETIPDSLADENLQKEGGRGVLLVKELMDSLVVNRNQVNIIKFFRK